MICVFLLRKWALAFVGVSILFCLNPLSEIYFSTPISQVFGVVYAIDIVIVSLFIFTLSWLYNKNNYIDKSMFILIWVYLLFFAVGFLKGVVLYGHPAAGMSRNYGALTPFFFLTVYGLNKNNKIDSIFVIKLIIYIGLFSIVIVSFKYFQNLVLDVAEPHRVFGNVNGLTMAFGLIAIGAAKLKNINISKRIDKYGSLFAFFLSVGVLVSAIRSVWLGLFLCFILFIPFMGSKIILRLFPSIFSAVTIILMFLMFFQNIPIVAQIQMNISERFDGILRPEEESSASFRLFAWAIYLERFYNNPIMGEGIGNRVEFIDNELLDSSIKSAEAHNQYVMTLAQRGLLGTLPLIAIFPLVYIKMRKIQKLKTIDDADKLLLITSFLCIFCTGIWLFFSTDNSFLWIMLGIFVWVHNRILLRRKV